MKRVDWRGSLWRPLIRSVWVIVLSLNACSADKGPRPDVLLITIDTLRADWIHAYGFEGETTPQIDALAARGVLFEKAIAAASLTAPAHASIMTSRYAREHSIGTFNGETRLFGGETLAERFRSAGYETAAFVSNIVLRRRSGLDRGFQTYDDELEDSEVNRAAYFERVAAKTAARAMDWLASRPRNQPVFVWLHLQDPHGPYTPPEEFEGQVGDWPLRMKRPLPFLKNNIGRAGIPAYQALNDVRQPEFYAGRYGEELLYADYWVGEVVEFFETRAAPRGGIVLLTADHGESMGELGWFFQHGHATTPDLARVPLLVVAPGASSSRVESLVSHVDIAPTLLDLAGLNPLPHSSGLSLAPVIFGAAPGESRSIFTDTDGEAAVYTANRLTRLSSPQLVGNYSGPPHPPEVQTLEWGEEGPWKNLENDVEATELLMRYIQNSAPLTSAEAMRPEHIEQLRALGYLPPEDERGETDSSQSAPSSR
ncbi:MAG: sulfatase [Myxococcota bacterium]|nr:sulfatase [Myxococcota bacterium]